MILEQEPLSTGERLTLFLQARSYSPTENNKRNAYLTNLKGLGEHPSVENY